MLMGFFSREKFIEGDFSLQHGGKGKLVSVLIFEIWFSFVILRCFRIVGGLYKFLWCF